MLRVVYNQYKGYCIPKGNTGIQSEHSQETIYTNGFNFFNWEDDELQQYSKITNYNEDEEEQENGDMYTNESKNHLNHEMSDLLKPSVLKNEITDKINDKINDKKQLNGKKIKKQYGKKKKKQKGNSDLDDFNIPSDVNKVAQLNKLHKELILNLKSQLASTKINDDEKILQFFDVSIYKEELDNLKDDEWLNDNNISFLYEYLERYQLNSFNKLIKDSIILLRPSMVYLLANTSAPLELKGVLPPLENSKFIFLPVNDNDDVETASAGSHWSLIVISLLDQTAFIYDTMERANETEAIQVIKKLMEYLGYQLKIKIIENTPQQINGSDCGIMICQITGFLLSRLLNLKYLETNYIDLSLDKVDISAIDGRIFLMGTLLNLVKHKQNLDQ
ncbi:Sentrin-specific protease 2 [Wickerhamomyces ciferrii]|uniref:Sentrin-specific protease 2 n=1 Tax=Wickerhamomyces ciferrii (strain ATCC 14091 / BCRC 22168 / CBS 111 / JCM 3599 / NBRC 0793 / NRRL Y-1031 F-60-10) TaxID=1206466 RepID=K0KAA4_WICCF|nr:Sentrin-specific protease 2 [Wickerhamomyces ciferrii]CCH41875.1 Sentrin-specific protease 2 [Wickerhamomyces ciferrii]